MRTILAMLMLTIFGGILIANYMETREIHQSTKKVSESDSGVFELERMASASSEIRQRVKTLVNNMNDVQKIAIVAALILPFFFREEWDNLTRFYQRLIDFEDYSALLGAWLVCAVVYYLWRPNVDSERSPKND